MTIKQTKHFDALLKKISFPGALISLGDGAAAVLNTAARQTVNNDPALFARALNKSGQTLAKVFKSADVCTDLFDGGGGVIIKCNGIKINASFALVFFMHYDAGSAGELSRAAGTEDIFPRAFIKDKQLNFKYFTQNVKNDFTDLGGSGYENYDMRFAGDYIVNELNIINTGRPAFSRCEFINTPSASNCIVAHRIPLLNDKDEPQGLLCVYPPALADRGGERRRKEQDIIEQKALEAALLKDILYVLQENGDTEYALKYVVFALGERLKSLRCGIFTYEEKSETFFFTCGYDSKGGNNFPRALPFPGTAGALIDGLNKTGCYVSRPGDLLSAHLRPGETASIIPLMPMQLFYGVLLFSAASVLPASGLDFLKQVAAQVSNYITRRKMMDGLKSEKSALERIVGNTAAMIMVADPRTHKILYANSALENAFPGSVGKICHDILSGRGAECDASFIPLETAGHSETFIERLNKWFDVSVSRIEWLESRDAILLQLVDITDNKLSRQRAEYLAYKDETTALPNRYSAEKDITALLKSGGARAGHLLLIDMDNFKNINDAYGHNVGDKLLFSIAQGLQSCCAENQVAYRLGGDEFLIFTSGGADGLDALLIKLTALSKKAHKIDGAVFYCTMSIGVVRCPEDGDNFTDLLRKADISLYKAKTAGKDSISFFMGREAELVLQDQLELERLLRNTIEADYHRFSLHYQPLVDLKTNAVIGAEALIRLSGDTGDTIYPQKFIPLCEYNGLIQPLGKWILATGFAFCRDINDSGFPDFKLNINMSLKQIQQFDIDRIVSELLSKSRVNPSNIILEITETAAYTDLEGISKALSSLKKTGIRLAIDDFGTGFTSMKALRDLPFDIVKIDISYISDILNPDENSATFVNLITELGHKSGRLVCAEGVENGAQAEYLKARGVDYAQGYLFSKPVPPAIFTSLLKK